MNIWVFGHSSCTRCGLSDTEKGWIDLISEKYNSANVYNFGEDGSDNLRIYFNIGQHLSSIQPTDVIIVGWSHPSRKTFVYDPLNTQHMAFDKLKTIFYGSNPAFFRSKHKKENSWSFKNIQNFAHRHLTKQNNTFFDTYYKNYYSDTESKLNFQAYQDSVKLKVPGLYLPFYFSKESVDQIDDSNLYYLDMILESGEYISKQDMHANANGHKLIADFFIKKIDYFLHSSK